MAVQQFRHGRRLVRRDDIRLMSPAALLQHFSERQQCYQATSQRQMLWKHIYRAVFASAMAITISLLCQSHAGYMHG